MNKNDFLYIIHGAHIFTQMAICYGLDTKKILFITDNDPKKYNRFLYGTQLRVKNPKTLFILKKKKICVITIFTGVYQREIENDLLKINKNISFV